jgi:hypothetical protein
MVIDGWSFSGTEDSPIFEVAPPDGHDFGITTAPDKFASIFEKYPKGRFIDIHEFIAYLHAYNHGSFNNENNSILIDLSYDTHYCQYFKTHPSTWTFALSNWLARKTSGRLSIKVDDGDQIDMNVTEEPFTIKIPEGAGSHLIEIKY